MSRRAPKKEPRTYDLLKVVIESGILIAIIGGVILNERRHNAQEFTNQTQTSILTQQGEMLTDHNNALIMLFEDMRQREDKKKQDQELKEKRDQLLQRMRAKQRLRQQGRSNMADVPGRSFPLKAGGPGGR
jgi:hypothetical protein